MDKNSWVTDFGCKGGCHGTGKLVVWNGTESTEVKCNWCDQWKSLDQKLETVDAMQKKGWQLHDDRQAIWEDGFNTGTKQIWGDIDGVLKDIANSQHAGFLIGSGLLIRLRKIRDEYMGE